MGGRLFQATRSIVKSALWLLLAIGVGLQGCEMNDQLVVKEKDPLPTSLIMKQREELPTRPADAQTGVLNLFLSEGGINKWLEVFPPEPCLLGNLGPPPLKAVAKSVGGPTAPAVASRPAVELQYEFRYAVGAQSRAAHPDSVRTRPWATCPDGGNAATFAVLYESAESATPVYVKKVKLQRKIAAKGECG